MTMNSGDEQLPDFPNIIETGINMNEPNEVIPIYTGEFKLVHNEVEIHVVGEIQYKWFPHLGAEFLGTVKSPSMSVFEFLQLVGGQKRYRVFIEGSELGECSISRTSSGPSITVGGTLRGTTVKGDKSIPVSKVVFSIPNLREYFGVSVRKGSTISNNRLQFEDDNYLIKIDKRTDFKDVNGSVESKGGYISLWHGELSKKKGSILFDALNDDFVNRFSTFLSFLNGRRCSPLFMQGFHDKELIWTDYSAHLIDTFGYVLSWSDSYSISRLNELYKKFSLIWNNENDKDFLVTAIHWYVEANSLSGFSEGSIIMTQTGLELIYNWFIIEKQKLLSGNDAENITASNKIRLLLSHLKVNFDIPNAFEELKTTPDITDGPDAFVQIRNAIVHSQEGKRKRIRSMSPRAKYQALQLGIWYIELALLKILDFDGVYHNRCIEFDEKVLWTSSKN